MMRVPPDHKIKVIAEIGAPTPGERREPRHREPAVLLGQGAKGPGRDSARKSSPKWWNTLGDF